MCVCDIEICNSYEYMRGQRNNNIKPPEQNHTADWQQFFDKQKWLIVVPFAIVAALII